MSDRDPVCDPDAIARLMYAGDLESLDRITRCYGDRLLAVGRRTCGCDDLAQDAVQDTLVIAAQRLRPFRGDGSLEGWASAASLPCSRFTTAASRIRW
jgi:DNA-directed RNA polymerase specialized sigma24 family protein